MINIETVSRLVHFYELHITFKDDFKPTDGDQFRELFAIVIALAKTKSRLRYQIFGEKAIFMQEVSIDPINNQIKGKLRSVRKNILPEIMNTVTDESRGIDAKEEEGVLETTHFVIDFSKKKKRLAIEYNQFGARIVDFASYLQHIGIAKKALTTVRALPVVKDNLKDLAKRINRTSEFVVRVHKNNLSKVKSIDNGLFSMLEASIDHFKSEYATVILKFDYKKRANTKEINATVAKAATALIRSPESAEYFETLELTAEDTEKNNKLEAFDLLVDKVKHRLNVQKKPRYRTIVSEDIISQMQEKLKTK